MHFQISVVLVQLAGKQRFQFVALSLLFQFFQMRKQFRQHRLVFLGLRHLDHLLGILQIRQQILIKGNILVQRIFLSRQFQCLFLIVPQRRVRRQNRQFFLPLFRVVVVKETSAKVRRSP